MVLDCYIPWCSLSHWIVFDASSATLVSPCISWLEQYNTFTQWSVADTVKAAAEAALLPCDSLDQLRGNHRWYNLLGMLAWA